MGMALVSLLSYSLITLTVFSGLFAGHLLVRLAPEEVPALRHLLQIRTKGIVGTAGLSAVFLFIAAPYPTLLYILATLFFIVHLLIGISIKNN